MLLLTNQFHDSSEYLSLTGYKKYFVPNRRLASISLLSRSSYTKPPFFEEVAPINFSLFIYNENGTLSIHRKKNIPLVKSFIVYF